MDKKYSRLWGAHCLTRREKELVIVLANGGRVVDFMHKYDIAKSTAHAHWGNVKKKLGIKDRSEIYVQHQVFLKTSN
jgi:DNA-binding CsgD family transcriptional regulator